MAFVIDGSQWAFDGFSPNELTSALETLLARLAVAVEREERVWFGDDLQTRPVFFGRSIWELWSGDSPVRLEPELKQELSAYLMRASYYLDEPEWPDGITDTAISIGEAAPNHNPDVAWAHYSVLGGRAVACLGWKRSGCLVTSSSAGKASVHFVSDEQGHCQFFRDAIEVERDTEECLQRFAAHAFPNLFFLDGLWQGLGDFEGKYARVRKELRRTLAILNDHGHWIFSAPPPALTKEEETQSHTGRNPDNQIIERRFIPHGLDVAPENPDVFESRKCRAARQRTLGGRTLYLEWHVKLEPHENRVHIHAPCPESEDRLIVGIFHRHLPLPRD